MKKIHFHKKILEVQPEATEEVAPEVVKEEVVPEEVAEDNGRASSRNFEDFEEQDDGANPIEVVKAEEVPEVVEEQAVVPEEPVEESVPAVEVETPPVEVEAEPAAEAVVEEVVVAEEAVTEEPVVEATAEEPVTEAVAEESPEVVPEVQEETQPAEEVAAEPTEVSQEEAAMTELQVQIGNYSRIAAKSTEDLIISYERAAKSIIEFIRAKKYAFGFKGDTDRKVAIWLQECFLQSTSNFEVFLEFLKNFLDAR